MSWEMQVTAGHWVEAPFKAPSDPTPGKKAEFTFQGIACTIEFTTHTEGVVTHHAKEKQYPARLKQAGGAAGGDDESWKDTNVAGIGSDEDKAQRKQVAQTEKAWASAGQSAGLNVWRVEHFTVQDVDPSTYGKFQKGDSYICLSTVADPDSGKLCRGIHFWLGGETTQDEQGTAAYKTVELDDYFDGEPIQHREPMGEESDAFKALFPGGVEYLEGGVDSGFKHVVPEGHDTKLYCARRVKGTTTVIQCPLRKAAINEGDCFILDAQDKIYVYDGSASTSFEKTAANAHAENIENKRSGGAEATHDIDDGFWGLLGE